jgi:hypothetical protein
LIGGFILAPDDLGQRRISLEFGGERLVRERIELFDAKNRNVVFSALASRVDQVVIHLARTADRALDLLCVDGGIDFTNYSSEFTLGKLRLV